jgi:uncharacterized protein YbcI
MVSDMETEEQEARVEDLVGRDWTDDVDVDGGRSLRAAIANAMVGLKKQYYGKGPTKAKTYINDSYVFCVMEGGLTRNEETLVHAGHERVVRDYRLTFQDVMAEETTTAIARLTGRQVLSYQSQIVFHPDRAFEIFVLDAPPEGGAQSSPRSDRPER